MASLSQHSSVADALHWAARRLGQIGKPAARLDAEVILSSLLNCSREQLYRDAERQLGESQRHRYEQAIEQRVMGVPVQYLTGVQEFWSIPFLVNAHVLIPRPETEFVVQAVLDRWPDTNRPELLDLGTGSGVIAVSLAAEHRTARFTASDISLEALRVASKNAAAAGVGDRIRFVCGDLFSPFRGEECRWHIVASNPPYISLREVTELPDEVRHHEPEQALYAGPEGTEMLESLISQTALHLRPGGWLIMEAGAGQKNAVEGIASRHREWARVEWVADLAGIDRVACLQFGHTGGKPV